MNTKRSIALHKAIAEKIKADESLLDIARQNLKNWGERDSRSNPYLDEWQRILGLSVTEILATIVADNERMEALRQATPFCGILTPSERWGIYEAFSA